MNNRLYLDVSLLLIQYVVFCSCASLYSPHDPLYELDNTNFDAVIFGKSNAWIVEFYSSWCGHCIRFAPIFKEFSSDIKTWRNVIDVAVVNCADSQNLKVCRDFDVVHFPTLRILKPFVNESDKGVELGGRNASALESGIVDFLESFQKDQIREGNDFSNWPNLQPLDISSISDARDILKKENKEYLILLVEHESSSLGKTVIMDLSVQTRVMVRRVLTTNREFLSSLSTTFDNSSLAMVIKIHKDKNEEILFRYPQDVNSSQEVRDRIFLHVMGSQRQKAEVTGSKNTPPVISSTENSAVHLVDLENALRYVLYQEVGVSKLISGTQCQALRDFLQVLINYFPSEVYSKEFLIKLNSWVMNQRNFTGEEFVYTLNKLQTDEVYIHPMRDYVGCKGSEPKFRGYPCSLWTLFHTLTVRAHNLDEESTGALSTDAVTVLPAIKNYVKYFFTCSECSNHFQQMAGELDATRDSSTSSRAVLWLWDAHNQVNRRLSGDATEDPHHPKVQFPPRSMCPSCHLTDEPEMSWDEVQVLRFLRRFYGEQGLLRGSSPVIPFHPASLSADSWTFQWFTGADVSLCVSLYAVSGLLLVLIFMLFRHQRRRKKNRYVSFYP